MTDINDLIGPEPIPVPSPKFPTPWDAIGNQVRSADHKPVFLLREEDSHTAAVERVEIARFIVEAVNVAVTQRDGNTFYSNAMKNASGRITDLRAANEQLTTRLAEAEQLSAELGNHLADARSAVDAEEGETVREAVTRRSLSGLAPILKQIRGVVGAGNDESTLSAVERVVAELARARARQGIVDFRDALSTTGIRKIAGDV